jgi:hypothetical protein
MYVLYKLLEGRRKAEPAEISGRQSTTHRSQIKCTRKIERRVMEKGFCTLHLLIKKQSRIRVNCSPETGTIVPC